MKHSRIFFPLAFSLLTFLVLPSALPRPSAASHVVSASNLAVFDDAWETVRDRYYDPRFHGVDWQAERARFRPMAERAASTAELYGVLRRMLGSLRDAHTRVYSPEERFDWQRPRFISVGLSVREVEGAPVVAYVERGSEADRAGLRAGDVILRVDGEDARSLFARRLRELAGSSTPSAARSLALSRLFDGERGSVALVEWAGPDGEERSARLRRTEREREASLKVRRLPGGVGLAEFDAFTQAVAVDLMRALAGKLRGASGLILDLRRNGGGEAEAMTEVASAFLPAGKSLGRFTDRSGRVQFEPHTRAAMLYAPDYVKGFGGPVVLLTSERTSSAAEIFVAALREARRATVLGESTCGCVLAVRRRHILPDGGALDVSEMDYLTALGDRLEGVGLAPDERVTPSRQDLRTGRDPALELALERLTGERR